MESKGFYRKQWVRNQVGGENSNTLPLSITKPFLSTIHLTQTGSQVQIYVDHYENIKANSCKIEVNESSH